MRIWAALILGLSLAACDPNVHEANHLSEGPKRDAIAVAEPIADLVPGVTDNMSEASDVVVPKGFLGTWIGQIESGNGATCENHFLMRIEFTGEGVRFYASEGAFLEMIVFDEQDLIEKSAMIGEGQEWENIKRWTLIDKGETLVRHDFADDGFHEPIRYVRCPS